MRGRAKRSKQKTATHKPKDVDMGVLLVRTDGSRKLGDGLRYQRNIRREWPK
jgi:hypothetical protein